MVNKDSVIFVVEDDKPYGNLVKGYLEKSGFRNVHLFHEETRCLQNMHQHPEVMISDYNLNYMSGLKLIQEARKISAGFFSILLSGTFHRENYGDGLTAHCIDKFILKGANELETLSKTLNNLMDTEYNVQFY